MVSAVPDLLSVLLPLGAGASTPEEKRRRLRSELVRWHPDKFVSKFGARLAEGDRQRVLDRVNATSQLLNALNASLQQQQA